MCLAQLPKFTTHREVDRSRPFENGCAEVVLQQSVFSHCQYRKELWPQQRTQYTRERRYTGSGQVHRSAAHVLHTRICTCTYIRMPRAHTLFSRPSSCRLPAKRVRVSERCSRASFSTLALPACAASAGGTLAGSMKTPVFHLHSIFEVSSMIVILSMINISHRGNRLEASVKSLCSRYQVTVAHMRSCDEK